MDNYPNLASYSVEELCLLEQVVVDHLHDPEHEHRVLLDAISELIVTAYVRGEYLPICDPISEAQHPHRRAA